MTQNLNDLTMPTDYNPSSEALVDYGTVSGAVEVVFKELAPRLIAEIHKYPYVAGCVAWLTHPAILEALASRKGASIIVQKEDFLRPDVGDNVSFEHFLRVAYEKIKPLCRGELEGLLQRVSYTSLYCGDLGVRCVGNTSDRRVSTMPRAHHKFLVFCDKPYEGVTTEEEEEHVLAIHGRGLRALSVWTGSFNFTKNGVLSFENAVIINDPQIASAFLDEYQQVATLSEPLDWTSPYVAPEWRIGS